LATLWGSLLGLVSTIWSFEFTTSALSSVSAFLGISLAGCGSGGFVIGAGFTRFTGATLLVVRGLSSHMNILTM
jgi:hypothetical protein